MQLKALCSLELRRPIELTFSQFYVMHRPTSENTGLCQKRCPVPLCILFILTAGIFYVQYTLGWLSLQGPRTRTHCMHALCGSNTPVRWTLLALPLPLSVWPLGHDWSHFMFIGQLIVSTSVTSWWHHWQRNNHKRHWADRTAIHEIAYPLKLRFKLLSLS